MNSIQYKALTTHQERALNVALKHSNHPVFKRNDIRELVKLAFVDEVKLMEIDLSSEEIEALMMGLNIGRTIY